MTGSAAGDAAGLARALRGAGYACDVEPRDALALLRLPAADAARLAASPERTAALALAREHGFTHLAVEIRVGSSETGAPVLRD